MTDEIFTPREGTVSLGKDYEYLMAAYYGLTFCTNDEIKDFKLSTNNKDFGDFDDVVIEATFNNDEEHIFAVQLKHTTRRIAQVNLVNESGNFSLKKYSNEFERIKATYAKSRAYKAPFKNLHFILLSTSALEKIEEFNDDWKKLEPTTKGEKVEYDVSMRRSKDFFTKKLLSVSQNEENFLCEFKSEKENSKTEEFFKQFTLYTKQKTAQEMESMIAGILFNTFKNADSDVVVNFLNYFSYWCRKQYGTFKLTRQDVRLKLAELVLTPYIPEANMDTLENISEDRTKLFFLLLTSFDIVLINNDSDEVINKVWNILHKQSPISSTQWSSPISGFYIDTLKAMFDIPVAALSENFSELSLKKIYSIMWHIGIFPLIIKTDKQSPCYEDIVSAIKLCRNNESKKSFVIVGKNDQFENDLEWSVLKNLENVSTHCVKSYDVLTESVLVSLQGRPYVSLKQFLDTDELLIKSIEVADLILMLDNTFIIGRNLKKQFPKCYINRQIPKVLIDINAIKLVDGDLFVISSDDEIGNLFGMNSVNIDKYLLLHHLEHFNNFLPKQFKMSFLKRMEEEQETLPEQFYIFAKGGCTHLQFEEICAMNKGRICHHIRFIDEKRVEWIESRGSVEKIQSYRLDVKTFNIDDFVQDQDALHHFSNKLNIICADPGMGKSAVMRILAYNCPFTHWVIMISLGEHAKFFREKRNIAEIIAYFHKKDTMTCLEQEVVNILLLKKQVIFFWDGFDELPNDCVGSVIAAVETLSNNGYPQWLAARNNSKEFLETTFGTLALTLTEFSKQNQYDYVYNRLMAEYEDNSKVDKIIGTVNKHISTSLSCGFIDYTGIPLQIHMVVEIYIRMPDTTHNKPIFITLTDIYQQFIEGKFISLFEKADTDPHNRYMQQIQDQYKHSQMVLYENAAVKTLYEDENLHDVNLECDELLNELREGEDTLGLIVGIRDDQKPIFAHKTYEEFLAALWLSKHWNSHPELVELLFEEKYSNVRLMFDMLLAENSPIHLAVLYKNLDMIHLYKDDIENSKDKGGRNVLHLACSWGRRYPLIKEMKTVEFVEVPSTWSTSDIVDEQLDYSLNKVAIDIESVVKIKQDDVDHLRIIEFLLKRQCRVFDNDNILKWSPFQYADRSFSLAALNIMLEYHTMSIDTLQNYKHISTVVHYSVRFSFDNLFKLVSEIPFIEYHLDGGKSNLLQLASESNNLAAVATLLQYNCYRKAVNEETPYAGNLLTTASFKGNLEIIDLLLLHGAPVNGYKFSPLAAAASAGKIDCCKRLLEAGIDVNAPSNIGDSPLLLSALLDHLEIMELLLENGADVNYVNNGRTALILAMRKSNVEMVKLLLQYKPDINYQCEGLGNTPLHYASDLGGTDVIKCLLEHGADPTIKSKSLLTPLHIALLNKSKENALELIKADPSVVNEYDDDKLTPILLATMANFPDVIQLLGELGADLHTPQSKITPLNYAAAYNFDSCVIALLNAGASVNHFATDGMTPLFCPIQHLTTTKILLENSADVEARHKSGQTVLHIVARNGSLEVMEELIKKGAQLEAKDDRNWTALHVTIYNKRLQMVQFLLDNGASVEDGNELLNVAVTVDFPECIPLLVKRGVSVNSKNNLGNTPLCYASIKGNSCVKALLENGADPNMLGERDLPPLVHAIYHGATNVMNQLIDAGADVQRGAQSLTPLHLGAFTADIFITVLLLRKGADVNALDDSGRSPLHYTCLDHDIPSIVEKAFSSGHADNISVSYNNEECAEELIASGANINQKDCEGFTPLHLACSNSASNLIRIFTKRGADVNALDNRGHSPLHLCYALGKIEDADFLLENGADLNIVDGIGETPLDNAMHRIFAQDLQQLDLLMLDKLRKLGANIDMPNESHRYTILHIAAADGNLEITQYLLENGANVDSVDDSNSTPIFYACSYNHEEIASILLEKNCKVNVTNEDGQTPLHFAAKNGLDGLIVKIVKAGGDIDAQNNFKSTPLHVAALQGNWKSCKILIDLGAHLGNSDYLGKSFMHYAVMSGNLDTVETLVKNGAPLDQKDDTGRTPLFIACSNGNLDMVHFLHRSGADILAQSNNGSNLLIEASQHTPVIKYLVESGANVNHTNDERETPLYSACSYNNYDGALYLIENGADVNGAAKEENLTPIHVASINGYVKIVELLLRENADLTIRSVNGNSAILSAAVQNNVNVLNLFLEIKGCDNKIINDFLQNEWNRCFIYFANIGNLEMLKYFYEGGLVEIDAKNEFGATAFWAACCEGKYDAVVYLKQNGANVGEKNIRGLSPLTVASYNGHFNIVKLLVHDYSVEVDDENSNGNSPLFAAALKGHLEIVEFLYERRKH